MYGKKNIQRDEYKFNILIAKKKERKKIKQIQDRKRQWEVEREKERGRERMCEEIQMTKKTKTVSHEKLSVWCFPEPVTYFFALKGIFCPKEPYSSPFPSVTS